MMEFLQIWQKHHVNSRMNGLQVEGQRSLSPHACPILIILSKSQECVEGISLHMTQTWTDMNVNCNLTG